jgi:hypothetical protein
MLYENNTLTFIWFYNYIKSNFHYCNNTDLRASDDYF